jgi:hypothetical protein
MRRELKRAKLFLTALILISVAFSCKKSKTPAPQTPPANLVAYWPLDGDATDKSLYGHNGTVNGASATTDRFNKANGALHFDGLSSFISVADKADLRLSGTDFTLNAWVKLDSYNPAFVSTIISKRLSGLNNGWLWAINGNLNDPEGAVYYGPGGGNADAIGSVVLATGKWYMVTCVYTLSNSTMSIYVNGVLDNQTTGILTANGSVDTPLDIGKDTAEGSYFFNGSIDEIKVYNTALTPGDVSKLYVAANGL